MDHQADEDKYGSTQKDYTQAFDQDVLPAEKWSILGERGMKGVKATVIHQYQNTVNDFTLISNFLP